MIIIDNHDDMIMMIYFLFNLVSRQQKIWATQQAFSWGNVSIFFAFLHRPTTVISVLSIFISPWHPRQFSRTCGILKCESVGLPLFTIVGWFTLVENSQWCWTLVIHHYRLIWKEEITAKMKRFWHLVFHNRRRLFFFIFFPPGLSYCHIVVVANNIWLVRFFIKRRDTGGALRCC